MFHRGDKTVKPHTNLNKQIKTKTNEVKNIST